MNLEILKRNISLHKLGIAELTGTEKRVYELLRSNLSELKAYTSETHDAIYYGKSLDLIIIRYNLVTGVLWLKSDEIWSFFRNLSIRDSDIKSFISWWSEMEMGLNSKLIYQAYGFITPDYSIKMI